MLSYAQKENYNWMFGQQAGITWNVLRDFDATGVFGTSSKTLSDLPSVISPRVQISTSEGCFSMSDAYGNILFYSDGRIVKNRNNGTMPNGSNLNGHASSAQSGIIIAHPIDKNKYIAFTLGYNVFDNFSYSVIDMELDNGLGDVIVGPPSQKNIPLTGHMGLLGESFTAVRKSADKREFWIVAIGRNHGVGAYLNVWEVTTAGVNTNCLRSILIPDRTNVGTSAIGYLIFNNQGNRFMWGGFGGNFIAFGDFDTANGTFSNLKTRDFHANILGRSYGIAYTNSDRYVYVSAAPSARNVECMSGLYVFDCDQLYTSSTPNTVAPVKSITIPSSLSDGTNGHFGAINMGPDGRMYSPIFNTKGLYVIDNPESPQNMEIYQLENFTDATNVSWGLPSFTAHFFSIQLTSEKYLCQGKEGNYSLFITGGLGYENLSKVEVIFGSDAADKKIIASPLAEVNYDIKYTYKSRGVKEININSYNANGDLIQEASSTMQIKIARCSIPVNHNISAMDYD